MPLDNDFDGAFDQTNANDIADEAPMDAAWEDTNPTPADGAPSAIPPIPMGGKLQDVLTMHLATGMEPDSVSAMLDNGDITPGLQQIEANISARDVDARTNILNGVGRLDSLSPKERALAVSQPEAKGSEDHKQLIADESARGYMEMTYSILHGDKGPINPGADPSAPTSLHALKGVYNDHAAGNVANVMDMGEKILSDATMKRMYLQQKLQHIQEQEEAMWSTPVIGPALGGVSVAFDWLVAEPLRILGDVANTATSFQLTGSALHAQGEYLKSLPYDEFVKETDKITGSYMTDEGAKAALSFFTNLSNSAVINRNITEVVDASTMGGFGNAAHSVGRIARTAAFAKKYGFSKLPEHLARASRVSRNNTKRAAHKAAVEKMIGRQLKKDEQIAKANAKVTKKTTLQKNIEDGHVEHNIKRDTDIPSTKDVVKMAKKDEAAIDAAAAEDLKAFVNVEGLKFDAEKAAVTEAIIKEQGSDIGLPNTNRALIIDVATNRLKDQVKKEIENIQIELDNAVDAVDATDKKTWVVSEGDVEFVPFEGGEYKPLRIEGENPNFYKVGLGDKRNPTGSSAKWVEQHFPDTSSSRVADLGAANTARDNIKLLDDVERTILKKIARSKDPVYPEELKGFEDVLGRMQESFGNKPLTPSDVKALISKRRDYYKMRSDALKDAHGSVVSDVLVVQVNRKGDKVLSYGRNSNTAIKEEITKVGEALRTIDKLIPLTGPELAASKKALKTKRLRLKKMKASKKPNKKKIQALAAEIAQVTKRSATPTWSDIQKAQYRSIMETNTRYVKGSVDLSVVHERVALKNLHILQKRLKSNMERLKKRRDDTTFITEADQGATSYTRDPYTTDTVGQEYLRRPDSSGVARAMNAAPKKPQGVRKLYRVNAKGKPVGKPVDAKDLRKGDKVVEVFEKPKQMKGQRGVAGDRSVAAPKQKLSRGTDGVTGKMLSADERAARDASGLLEDAERYPVAFEEQGATPGTHASGLPNYRIGHKVDDTIGPFFINRLVEDVDVIAADLALHATQDVSNAPAYKVLATQMLVHMRKGANVDPSQLQKGLTTSGGKAPWFMERIPVYTYDAETGRIYMGRTKTISTSTDIKSGSFLGVPSLSDDTALSAFAGGDRTVMSYLLDGKKLNFKNGKHKAFMDNLKEQAQAARDTITTGGTPTADEMKVLDLYDLLRWSGIAQVEGVGNPRFLAASRRTMDAKSLKKEIKTRHVGQSRQTVVQPDGTEVKKVPFFRPANYKAAEIIKANEKKLKAAERKLKKMDEAGFGILVDGGSDGDPIWQSMHTSDPLFRKKRDEYHALKDKKDKLSTQLSSVRSGSSKIKGLKGNAKSIEKDIAALDKKMKGLEKYTRDKPNAADKKEWDQARAKLRSSIKQTRDRIKKQKNIKGNKGDGFVHTSEAVDLMRDTAKLMVQGSPIEEALDNVGQELTHMFANGEHAATEVSDLATAVMEQVKQIQITTDGVNNHLTLRDLWDDLSDGIKNIQDNVATSDWDALGDPSGRGAGYGLPEGDLYDVMREDMSRSKKTRSVGGHADDDAELYGITNDQLDIHGLVEEVRFAAGAFEREVAHMADKMYNKANVKKSKRRVGSSSGEVNDLTPRGDALWSAQADVLAEVGPLPTYGDILNARHDTISEILGFLRSSDGAGLDYVQATHFVKSALDNAETVHRAVRDISQALDIRGRKLANITQLHDELAQIDQLKDMAIGAMGDEKFLNRLLGGNVYGAFKDTGRIVSDEFDGVLNSLSATVKQVTGDVTPAVSHARTRQEIKESLGHIKARRAKGAIKKKQAKGDIKAPRDEDSAFEIIPESLSAELKQIEKKMATSPDESVVTRETTRLLHDAMAAEAVDAADNMHGSMPPDVSMEQLIGTQKKSNKKAGVANKRIPTDPKAARILNASNGPNARKATDNPPLNEADSVDAFEAAFTKVRDLIAHPYYREHVFYDAMDDKVAREILDHEMRTRGMAHPDGVKLENAALNPEMYGIDVHLSVGDGVGFPTKTDALGYARKHGLNTFALDVYQAGDGWHVKATIPLSRDNKRLQDWFSELSDLAEELGGTYGKQSWIWSLSNNLDILGNTMHNEALRKTRGTAALKGHLDEVLQGVASLTENNYDLFEFIQRSAMSQTEYSRYGAFAAAWREVHPDVPPTKAEYKAYSRYIESMQLAHLISNTGYKQIMGEAGIHQYRIHGTKEYTLGRSYEAFPLPPETPDDILQSQVHVVHLDAKTVASGSEWLSIGQGEHAKAISTLKYIEVHPTALAELGDQIPALKRKMMDYDKRELMEAGRVFIATSDLGAHKMKPVSDLNYTPGGSLKYGHRNPMDGTPVRFIKFGKMSNDRYIGDETIAQVHASVADETVARLKKAREEFAAAKTSGESDAIYGVVDKYTKDPLLGGIFHIADDLDEGRKKLFGFLSHHKGPVGHVGEGQSLPDAVDMEAVHRSDNVTSSLTADLAFIEGSMKRSSPIVYVNEHNVATTSPIYENPIRTLAKQFNRVSTDIMAQPYIMKATQLFHAKYGDLYDVSHKDIWVTNPRRALEESTPRVGNDMGAEARLREAEKVKKVLLSQVGQKPAPNGFQQWVEDYALKDAQHSTKWSKFMASPMVQRMGKLGDVHGARFMAFNFQFSWNPSQVLKQRQGAAGISALSSESHSTIVKDMITGGKFEYWRRVNQQGFFGGMDNMVHMIDGYSKETADLMREMDKVMDIIGVDQIARQHADVHDFMDDTALNYRGFHVSQHLDDMENQNVPGYYKTMRKIGKKIGAVNKAGNTFYMFGESHVYSAFTHAYMNQRRRIMKDLGYFDPTAVNLKDLVEEVDRYTQHMTDASKMPLMKEGSTAILGIFLQWRHNLTKQFFSKETTLKQKGRMVGVMATLYGVDAALAMSILVDPFGNSEQTRKDFEAATAVILGDGVVNKFVHRGIVNTVLGTRSMGPGADPMADHLYDLFANPDKGDAILGLLGVSAGIVKKQYTGMAEIVDAIQGERPAGINYIKILGMLGAGASLATRAAVMASYNEYYTTNGNVFSDPGSVGLSDAVRLLATGSTPEQIAELGGLYRDRKRLEHDRKELTSDAAQMMRKALHARVRGDMKTWKEYYDAYMIIVSARPHLFTPTRRLAMLRRARKELGEKTFDRLWKANEKIRNELGDEQ